MEQRAGANVHYTLLIACVLVAFFLGAILSGFLVSCYCSRSAAHRARRLGKDPEASLPHALSLRSLAKLNGLLDGQPKEDKLDVSTPKMYSSFIPNGRAEHHLHSPAHQGLPLGDPELSLSQSLSQGDGELSGLPTPDSTPELPIKNMKALRHHQYEKNQNCNNAKDKPKSGPSCSGSSLGFMAVVGNSLTQQVFPFSHHHSNSLSNGAAHGAGASSTSLHLPEERKISNDERAAAAAAAGGAGVIPHHHHSQQSLPQTVVDVSALDELLKHIHEVSASGTGGIKVLTSTSSSSLFPGPSGSSGGHHHNHHHHHHSHHGQTRTHHYNHGHHHSNHHNNNTSGPHQQQIPETASTSYYSTSALPSDSLPKRIEPPPQNSTSSSATSSSSSSSSSNNPTSSTSIPSSSSSSSSTPLQQQVIPERPGGGSSVSVTRHHSQRHSLIKMGSGGGAVPRHHSFNQRGPQHAQFLARMNTNNSSSSNNNNNNNSPAGAGGARSTNSESKQPSVASACLTRQHSYSEGPHIQRAAIVRRTASLKPQIPPKPLFLPNTATSEVAEAGKYNY